MDLISGNGPGRIVQRLNGLYRCAQFQEDSVCPGTFTGGDSQFPGIDRACAGSIQTDGDPGRKSGFHGTHFFSAEQPDARNLIFHALLITFFL